MSVIIFLLGPLEIIRVAIGAMQNNTRAHIIVAITPEIRSTHVATTNTQQTVTECLTSDIFSMLLCGVSDCIIVFSIVLAP